MKSIYTILFCLFTIAFTNAQSRGINYKALISDNAGAPLASQTITVRFTILEGNMATNEVYKELHTTTTDANGIIIVSIGEGTNLSGDFNTINWGLDKHFIKTEINTGSGFVDFGTTEFKTVPYALYAESTGVGSPFAEITTNQITAANTNANFVLGSPSTEDQNNVNLDSRMLFDKSKAAFRAGSVDGTQWNNANRGLYSFAAGRNTTASGVGTTAFGKDTQALTSYSTALGDGTIASGYASLTVGVGTKSNNSSQFVNGTYNVENSNALLIVGNGTSDTERQNALVVKNDGSIILGANQFENDFSTNNDNSRLFFDKSKGAFRVGTTDSGDLFNSSYWNDNNVGMSSAAFGLNTIASGEQSAAFGIRTIASSKATMAIGQYNIDDSDALFIVGNGSSAPLNGAIRGNAFKVMRNGDVNINNLSGVGIRNVKVTDDGNLIADTNSAKSYNIGPYDFEASFPDAEVRRNLTFVYLLDNIQERAVSATIHLPNNATITGFTTNYFDNSSSTDLLCIIFRIPLGSSTSTPAISVVSTSGNVNSLRSLSASLSETVDNENFMYVFRVVPSSGQNWDAPNTYIRSVQIQYEEN